MGYHVISFLSYFGDRNMHFFRQVRLAGRKFFLKNLIGRHASNLPPMEYEGTSVDAC